MSKTEHDAEAARIEALLQELSALSEADLAKRAGVEGVDPKKYKTREELVAAVEAKISDEIGKVRLAEMEKAEAEAAKMASSLDNVSRVVRALNAEFCRDIPQEGRGGAFEPEEDHPRFGGDYNVPNGKYRVAGSEWMFLIHKKKLQGAERATEANNWGGKHVITVE